MQKKWLLNKYYYSYNVYKKINIYDIWIMRRLLMQGFQVFFSFLYIKKKKKLLNFYLYTSATIYDIQNIFKIYKYIGQNYIELYFCNNHCIKIYCSFYKNIIKFLLKKKSNLNIILYDLYSNEIIDIAYVKQSLNCNLIQAFKSIKKNYLYTFVVNIFQFLLTLTFNIQKELDNILKKQLSFIFFYYSNCSILLNRYYSINIIIMNNLVLELNNFFFINNIFYINSNILLNYEEWSYSFSHIYIKYSQYHIKIYVLFLFIVFPIFIKLFRYLELNNFSLIILNRRYINIRICLLLSNLILIQSISNKYLVLKLYILSSMYIYDKQWIYELYSIYNNILIKLN